MTTDTETVDQKQTSQRTIPSLFETRPDGVVRFLGTTFDEHLTAWKWMAERLTAWQWGQAAVAASLQKQNGQRTDLTGGQTVIQQFCAHPDVNIGAQYFSKLVKTHETFRAAPLPPGAKELLTTASRLKFKHFLVAANYSENPISELMQARDEKWSANEFERVVTARKKALLPGFDGGTPESRPEDDHDAVEEELQPSVVTASGIRLSVTPSQPKAPKTPRGLHAVTLYFPTHLFTEFKRQVQALAAATKVKDPAVVVFEAVNAAYENLGTACEPGSETETTEAATCEA